MAINGNGKHGTSDSVSSTTYGASARCIARIIARSFDACDEADTPLSELQRVTVIEAALLEFDGFGTHLASLVTVDRLLRDLRYE
jgi:hypothetical protein